VEAVEQKLAAQQQVQRKQAREQLKLSDPRQT
jgi:hypothetical protein